MPKSIDFGFLTKVFVFLLICNVITIFWQETFTFYFFLCSQKKICQITMLDTEELATIGFSLLFPLLYTKGPSWVSFYTKFVIYYTSMTLSATVCLPFTLLRPKDPRNLLWTTYFMKKTAKLLGKYNIPNFIFSAHLFVLLLCYGGS